MRAHRPVGTFPFSPTDLSLTPHSTQRSDLLGKQRTKLERIGSNPDLKPPRLSYSQKHACSQQQ